ncbi:MAG TPA: PH domain-containing protein [Microbacterium sp.]|nr:PH domain-containing protein [Microbacterium sp.]
MSESQTPQNPEPNPSSEPNVAPPAPVAPNEAPADPAPPAPVPPLRRRRESEAAPAVPVAPTAPDFPASREPIPAPAELDEGTYRGIREPRRRGLALDGTWHQISPKYVVSQFVQEGLLLVVVAVAAAAVWYFTGQWWPWIAGGAIMLVQIVSLAILPRQAKALGYMLRGDDIVFRKGILWQRMVAVPYGRMQLIDITHGPLDRIFGVSKLKMVTAAASTGVEIPGLGQQAAEALRDTLIEVAETRRTGL